MSEEATTTEATAEATATEATAAVEASAEASTEVTTKEAGNDQAETKEQAKAGSETEAEVKEPEGAPESYADFTMPEGVTLDPELTDQFKGVAKDLNLTQDQAQKVAELGAQMRQRDAQALIDARAEWVKATTEQFTPADLAIAKKAAETFGGGEFVTFLNESGLGNHPLVVKALVGAGKPTLEDRVVAGGDRTDTPNRSHADKLFGPKE